ncbi:RNA-binding S4 domain-containing protein [Nocardioides perillae]|uniref:RNA-binding S4 domain-containing protein n=1 Tax=Nocardioides perillae TaxID=1119534 RepID=UPI003CCDF806
MRDEAIRLGQFLKLADLVETGAEAKPVVAEGLVRVNGEVETRRGRQLVVGDVVELGGVAARVAGPAGRDGGAGGDDDGGEGLPW